VRNTSAVSRFDNPLVTGRDTKEMCIATRCHVVCWFDLFLYIAVLGKEGSM